MTNSSQIACHVNADQADSVNLRANQKIREKNRAESGLGRRSWRIRGMLKDRSCRKIAHILPHDGIRNLSEFLSCSLSLLLVSCRHSIRPPLFSVYTRQSSEMVEKLYVTDAHAYRVTANSSVSTTVNMKVHTVHTGDDPEKMP